MSQAPKHYFAKNILRRNKQSINLTQKYKKWVTKTWMKWLKDRFLWLLLFGVLFPFPCLSSIIIMGSMSASLKNLGLNYL
jgi:uncharacterized membrane protein